MGASKDTGGCPNIQGVYKCIGVIQTPSKHTFFMLCMYREHPNIWGCPNIQGAYKCMGAIWTHPKSDKACFLCVVCSTGASNRVSRMPEGMCVKLATLSASFDILSYTRSLLIDKHGERS